MTRVDDLRAKPWMRRAPQAAGQMIPSFSFSIFATTVHSCAVHPLWMPLSMTLDLMWQRLNAAQIPYPKTGVFSPSRCGLSFALCG
jgi:hypothetical protein